MKFLLVAINSKYIHSNPGLFSLKAYAKEYAEHVQISEYTINMLSEDILAGIYDEKPDIIGFSCYIWNWNMVQDLVCEIHKLLPTTPIWLGGPEVSYQVLEFQNKSDLFQKMPGVTGVMVGEGEQTFLEVLKYYLKVDGCFDTLESISGLCLPNGLTKARESLDMNTLPFLYDGTEDLEDRIVYYESQRGCPFSCSYCLSSLDKCLRLRDVKLVEKELQFFLNKKVPQVKFIDRTFNCNHSHAMAILRYIKEHDNGVTNFHFEIAGDILTKEEISILQSLRPGQVQLEIGVQTTNLQTIQAINRKMDLVRLKENVESTLEKKNIHIHLDLIAGLPYENYDTFVKSFNEVYSMHPHQLQLGFLKVLKGAKIREEATEYGIGYEDKPPYEVLYTNWISYEELRKLKMVEEMVEAYYNSGQFIHTVSYAESFFSTPFDLYYGLAIFYKERGYLVNTPSRMNKYQILLEYLSIRNPEEKELLSQLLTFDAYLRENIKSRPIFSSDMNIYKIERKELYRNENLRRIFLSAYLDYDARQMERMTHMEFVSYPVWEELPEKIRKKLDAPIAILIDYKKRNPLTKEALYFPLENDWELGEKIYDETCGEDTSFTG